ncbi:MAG TPA: TlpA disulfide reductase family protein [Stellaceae bacterium]|nr:TlpA disulfide reductase family protein [Stellaceae bacterium]
MSFGTAVVALLLAMTPPARADDSGLKLGEFIAVTPSQPAPDVAFTDIDGKPVTLADFKGRPVVLNLWATWCDPCVREMPALDRLQADFVDKLRVVAVSEDRTGAKKVEPFVASAGFHALKVFLDPKGDVGRAFGVRGLPTSIVIDAAGRVIGKVEGPADWNSAKMLGVLSPLLSHPGGPLKNAAAASR